MSYTVRGYPLSKINLKPATVEEEVLQNVAVILSTRRGSCPLAREIGLRGDFVDKPFSIAKTMLVADILDSISTQEPRAEVVSVSFENEGDEAGKLVPVLEVNIIG